MGIENGLKICKVDVCMFNSFWLQKKIEPEEYICILSSIQPPPKVCLNRQDFFTSSELKKALDVLDIVSLWWPSNVNEGSIEVLEDSKKRPTVHMKKEFKESLSPAILQRLERFHIILE